MIQLDVEGRRIPVPPEPFVIGAGPDAGLRLEGPGMRDRHVVITVIPAGGAAIRLADPEADVLVNGVRLGADPTPLLHGDKVTLPGHELRVSDEQRAGSTQMMPAFPGADRPVPTHASAPLSGPTINGRLVCLTDGREYLIPDAGLVFGRDAACDVVVASTEASRRHAEIRPGPTGYVLADSSANGTVVNGIRIEGTRILARADVIRIGTDEFRFYADAPAPAAAPPPAAVGARQRLNDTMHGIPVAPPPAMSVPMLNDTLHGIPATPAPGTVPALAPLASLLVRSGVLKGQRLPVRAAVVNVGRAEFNDVILPEPSVSTQHAKLQRREGVWVISDLGSTNGTFVDGERVRGEAPLAPGATVKLGEVTVLFEPMDSGAEPVPGTQQIRRLEDTAESVRPRRSPPRPEAEPTRSVSPVAIGLFLILLAAAAALVFLR
jgi:pSer/pThr/pTyr-binding forkhead associated (FHA) protein